MDREKCKKCGRDLIKKETRRSPEQLKKAYYYTAYYYCNYCRKMYHSDKFKVENNMTPLFGEERNESEYDVRIWTDGACVHNGHPNARASWAFVSDGSNDSEVHEEAGLVVGKQTNNVAEALGIYHALLWSKEKGYKYIQIHTDSQISIYNMRKRVEDILHNAEIFRNIQQVIREGGMKVRFEKVLGHSGDINNEKADKLANTLATKGI